MRCYVPVFALVLALAVSPGIPASQRGGEDDISDVEQTEAVHLLEIWVEALMDFDRLPGMTIAVVQDQEIVYARGFGHADEAGGVKATPGTIHSICSISKLFTSIAVMQLRDAGELSLDDPVSKHLPWFEPETVSEDAAAPTIASLLLHTSGLPCEPDHTFWDDPALLRPDREELIDRVSHIGMSFPTNTSHNYSNLGYALLGEIVSAVSGMEYNSYIQERILEPLGMTSTTPFPPAGPRGVGMATGYGRWPREGSRVTVSSTDEKAMTPAGGMFSTAEDLARFATWQFGVLDGDESPVLSAETLREMYEEHWSDPAWGLGFAIYSFMGDKLVGHVGGCPGYKSQIILCPEKKIAVVVMLNASDAPQFTLAFRAYEIMSYALSETAEGGVQEASEWEAYTGRYTADRAWSEAEVLEWDGSLAVMWLPTSDPVGSLVILERVEGNAFRQVGSDGELGKHFVFKSDADGHVIGMKFNNNLLKKTSTSG